MATPRLFSLSRTLFTTTIAANKQTLASYLFSHTFSSKFSLLRLRPVASNVGALFSSPQLPSPVNYRSFSTETFSTENSLTDSNVNFSNGPPPKEFDGCDYEHCLVAVDKPDDENVTRDEIIDSYIKLLAQVVGSEEEARMKIYSVSTKHYFAFGALVSKELSEKLKMLEQVRFVLPDVYCDVKNKKFGGEPFINGQAVPYDPKYHEEFVRIQEKLYELGQQRNEAREGTWRNG